MATEDISRSANNPKQRYASARMQQGRVITDDDFNEAERIENEDKRRERIDVIGPAGTPNTGFQIAQPTINAKAEMDFNILAGTFYLGGLRLEAFAAETYLTQPDWLEQPAPERAAPTQARYDLVYLEGWQQPVEAVEDNELFEPALAGPDTSTRVRNMRRVRVFRGVPNGDCATGWQQVVLDWAMKFLGNFDPLTSEKVVNTTLQIDPASGGPSNDLCSPPVAGGYLGAENQAIRVQIADSDHFTWGFDNGAPLYRVQVDFNNFVVEMLTEPKDQAHWPLADHIVEILPWSAVLDNGEKLAEPVGFLTRVFRSYDPDLHTLTLVSNPPFPPGFGQDWTLRSDKADLGPPYYFMRVWNRGNDTGSLPLIPVTPGQIPLGNTGLLATFGGSQRVAGDHWIIAARPETPDLVVPWAIFQQPAAPQGIHRFYVPLAIIQWKPDSVGKITGTVVDDCRPTFLPLTQRDDCCTYVVGDGINSHGQFKSIQQAVDSLPAEGGCICVLPGTYYEDVFITGRHNITIEGCGARSSLLGMAESKAMAVLHIVDSQDITVRALRIANNERIDVLMVGRKAAIFAGGRPGLIDAVGGLKSVKDLFTIAEKDKLKRVELADLVLEGRDDSAVYAIGVEHVTIRDCAITLHSILMFFKAEDDAGRWPGVFVSGDELSILDNTIVAEATEMLTRTPLGGIQIAGGSERVDVRGNRIDGGSGLGITLGSIVGAPPDSYSKFLKDKDYAVFVDSWLAFATGWYIYIDANGCIKFGYKPPTGPDGKPLQPVSTGPLDEIHIVDNEISGMGQSGIGVVFYWDLSKEELASAIVVDHLRIDDNWIHGCLRADLEEIELPLRDYAAYGAVALGAGEAVAIRGNRIENNGKSHVDPVCGVFVLDAAGLSVERNVIRDNAPRIDSDAGARPGMRGGIVASLVREPTVKIETQLFGDLVRGAGVPAARIHDNVVVTQEGRALRLLADGAVTVADNQLTSYGIGTLDFGLFLLFPKAQPKKPTSPMFDKMGGVAVFILDVGTSNEMFSEILGYQIPSTSPPPLPSPLIPRAVLNGKIMFVDNQVTMDLIDKKPSTVLNAVYLTSRDEVEVTDNQVTCETFGDKLIVDTLVMALSSCRVLGNRFKESIGTTTFSAIAQSNLLCNLSNNQSTHCVATVVPAGVADIKTHNQSVLQAFAPHSQPCQNADADAKKLLGL